MDRQSQLRSEAEKKLQESEQTLKNVQAKSKQLITALQTQLEEQSNSRVGNIFDPICHSLSISLAFLAQKLEYCVISSSGIDYVG